METWLWPQWTMAGTLLMSFGMVSYKHGKPRDNYNVWVWLIDAAFTVTILYFGGFWR